MEDDYCEETTFMPNLLVKIKIFLKLNTQTPRLIYKLITP